MLKRLQEMSLLGILYNFTLLFLYATGLLIGFEVNIILGFIAMIGLGLLTYHTKGVLKLSNSEAVGASITMMIAYIVLAFFQK